MHSLEIKLHGEGTAAAACALYVRVIELKPRAFESFDVVDGDTVEIHLAHLVDQDLQAVKLVDVVAGFVDLILEGHLIAKARAAAAHHGNTQARWLGRLLRQNFFYFVYGYWRQLNHFQPPEIAPCALQRANKSKAIIPDFVPVCARNLTSPGMTVTNLRPRSQLVYQPEPNAFTLANIK